MNRSIIWRHPRVALVAVAVTVAGALCAGVLILMAQDSGGAKAAADEGAVPGSMSQFIGGGLQAESKAAFAEGVITRGEYLDAATRTVQCIKDLGYPVVGPTWGADDRLHYTVGPVSVSHPPGTQECYDHNLNGIDQAWANGLAHR